MNRCALLICCALVAGCSRDAGVGSRAESGDSIGTLPTQHVEPPAAPSVTNAPKLLPADQADPSFSAFRSQVLAALQRKDTSFLYDMLAPEMKNSFGGDDSIAGFRRIWEPSKPGTQIWDALSRALTLGAKKADSTFVFPYVYAFWPDSIDAFKHVAITGENVPARAEANEQSPAIATLNYDIMPVETWENLGEQGVPTRASWARIKLPDGRTAWVNGLHAYSPVGWRGFFEKRGGRWVLTLFVAGD